MSDDTNREPNPTNDPGYAGDDPEARKAAIAVVAAVQRLQIAIEAASPPQGQELLAVHTLAGAVPSVTVQQKGPGQFVIVAGLVGIDGNKHLEIFRREFIYKNMPDIRPLLL